MEKSIVVLIALVTTHMVRNEPPIELLWLIRSINIGKMCMR